MECNAKTGKVSLLKEYFPLAFQVELSFTWPQVHIHKAVTEGVHGNYPKPDGILWPLTTDENELISSVTG